MIPYAFAEGLQLLIIMGLAFIITVLAIEYFKLQPPSNKGGAY